MVGGGSRVFQNVRRQPAANAATGVPGPRVVPAHDQHLCPGDPISVACGCPAARRDHGQVPVELQHAYGFPELPLRFVPAGADVSFASQTWHPHRVTSPAKAFSCAVPPWPSPVSSVSVRFSRAALLRYHRVTAGYRACVRLSARYRALPAVSCCANRDVVHRLVAIDRVVVSACAMGPVTDWLAVRRTKASSHVNMEPTSMREFHFLQGLHRDIRRLSLAPGTHRSRSAACGGA